MIKYLIILGMFYQPKNKLHKAIQEFIGQQNRKVIKEENLQAYKKYLGDGIERLNDQHRKCTRVSANFWKSETDEHLHLENVVSLSMFKFKEKGVEV
ncbi:MAG: hypothetical protein KGZ85_07870 [Ignavibacterium sp.]|nr:hypothetical protein [Ignavibacterium sp.]